MIDRTRSQFPSARKLRIGAVSYLNSKPLIDGLAQFAADAELILDVPSRLADDLARGQLDVALIPSVEAFSDADYEVVSDACVATHGPVLSVKLYSRVHPGSIRTLALDEGSRTSAALVQVMLEERFGVRPQLQPLALGKTVADTTADAILLIGDRAMHAPNEQFHSVWDLGEEWLKWTGLPFVFAMWVTRKGTELHGLDQALTLSRNRGVSRIAVIAQREAPRLNLTSEVAEAYLRDNLHFQIGSAERHALALFQELASQIGLARPGELAYRDAATTAHSGAIELLMAPIRDAAESLARSV